MADPPTTGLNPAASDDAGATVGWNQDSKAPVTWADPTVTSGSATPARPERRSSVLDFLLGPTPQLEEEVRDLLRQRLRIVSGVTCLVLGIMFLVRRTVAPSMIVDLGQGPIGQVLHASIIALTATVTVALFRSRPSLRALRAIDLTLFLALTSFILLFRYQALTHLDELDPSVRSPAFDAVDVQRSVALSNLQVALILVFYGVFIPNTFRRALTLLGGVMGVALLITVVAALREPALAEELSFLLPMSAVALGLALFIGVHGSFHIDRLRRAAFEAKREARELGQYRIVRQLGAGGMGEVYLAEHRHLKRPCALKLVRPERAGDPATLARFRREVEAMTRLTHWNVVEVFDYGQADDGTLYYIMEYLPGLNLDEMVGRFGPLPPSRAVHFLRQICAALTEAHGKGLIHRDLKPGNVLVGERGGIHDVAKLLDFGLVLEVRPEDVPTSHLTQVGTVLGTPHYMSPEQAGGLGTVSPASDLYSLGAVAYYLLTGRPPFVRQTVVQTMVAHIAEPPEPPTRLNPAVPADLEAIVLSCLEKEPHRRIADAEELGRHLASCQCANSWTAADAAAWWSTHAPTVPDDVPGK